mgnify:CR=1 FL=1
MGFVIDYIVETSDKRVSSYDTLKRFIDEREQDTFGEFDDHQLNDVSLDRHNKFAEDHPQKCQYRNISKSDILRFHNRSLLKYFLDGSRHVYKVGDVLIAGTVYPVVAGQIIVGCCIRENRQVREFMHRHKLVIAMPMIYDADNHGYNFFRKKCVDINKAILDNSNISPKIQFDSILPYKIDGDITSGRNKYLHQAITVIQNEMMDEERMMVNKLCADHTINEGAMLVKDGTLEYKKDFTNKPDADLDSAMFDLNIENVIGVSKLFDPELLNGIEPQIGKIIADLPAYARTNAFRYVHEGKNYCMWYLRLRETPNAATRYSDVVKVEIVMVGKNRISSQTIDLISTHLINEAYPVCFGRDSRWANHLYPVYLTESYCKSKYINDQIIIKLI